MTWHFPHYTGAFIISAFCSGLFGLFAWRHRLTPGASSFAFLMLAITNWTLMSIPEAAAVEVSAKLFWVKLEYLGIAPAGMLWLIFSARFSRYDAWLTKKTMALLWVIPSITILMVFTNRWHHFLHSGTALMNLDGVETLVYFRGPYFWVHIAYNYLTLLAGTLLLMRAALSHSKLYRRQVTPILVSSVIPWGANVLYITRAGPFPYLDVTPISFTIIGFAFFWSLFRSRIFKIVPMARDLLVEQMDEGIIVLDDACGVIDVNPSARQFFRHTAPPIGKDARKVFTLWPLLSPYMTGGSVEHGEAVVPGTPSRTFMFSVSPLKDLYGSISGRLIVLRDITDRKAAEEAIRDSEEKFRNIFKASPDPTYIAALDGRIIEFNDVLMVQSGYSSEDIASMNVINFYAHPEDRHILIKRILEEGCVENYELQLKRKDGTLIETLATVVSRKDKDDNVIGFQGIVKDVTEKRRMELQLMQSEKLSSLGTMISGVAHELNNPLTSIIGNAQLLARRDVPDNIRNKVNVILKESIRSSKIVAGLLAFAREHKPERSMVNINTVVMESMKLREYDLKVNSIGVKVTLREDLPETFADPFQIQQVFINIISNARDELAGRDRSALAIKTDRKDSSIIVEFTDNGPGIPDALLKKIFDPFFTTKDIGKGTGLGLSIAYGIIKEHGGTISVESKPEKGTKFIVVLPITNRGKPVPGDVVRPVEPARHTATLLVVDDEESVRELLAEALSEGGYRAETASNGEEAMGLLGKRSYDAVISDIKMPGMGGKELYEYVRKYSPEIADRIIFITGDVLNKETESFIRTTKNRSIEKPFNTDALLKILDDLLSG
jgi:PAS domain S-box-containing protein